MVQFDSSWFSLIQIGLVWFKLVRFDSNWFQSCFLTDWISILSWIIQIFYDLSVWSNVHELYNFLNCSNFYEQSEFNFIMYYSYSLWIEWVQFHYELFNLLWMWQVQFYYEFFIFFINRVSSISLWIFQFFYEQSEFKFFMKR